MITLIEAKKHLRINHDDDDDDNIAKKLSIASAIICDCIGITAFTDVRHEYFDSEADHEAACLISERNTNIMDAAILLALGELYASRKSLPGPLSASGKRILERLRTPSFA
jgi:hypothetical protein